MESRRLLIHDARKPDTEVGEAGESRLFPLPAVRAVNLVRGLHLVLSEQ